MTTSTDLSPIVIPAGVDVNTLPRRSYDFSKGDRRFTALERAIEHGTNEAQRTGVRQLVRPDSKPAFVESMFIVQAIGS